MAEYEYWSRGRTTREAPWRWLDSRVPPPDAYAPLVARKTQEYPAAYQERRSGATAYQIPFLHMRPDAYAPPVNREMLPDARAPPDPRGPTGQYQITIQPILPATR